MPQFTVKRLKTMRVKMKEGGNECIINETDFDDAKHSLVREAPAKKTPVKKVAPAPRSTEKEGDE